MADWSNVGKTEYGPGSRLTRGGETRFYIPNYNWLRQDTGGKWVSPEGFKKWWADNKPGQEPPDMTRQGVPAGQTPREPLVKGKPAEPLKPSEPAGETPEQKRARERAEIAKRHAQMRADLERDFPGDKPRPAADQSAIEKRHAELRKSDEDARIRRRYFYDKPEDSPKPVVPKPAAAQPEPEPKPAVTQTSSGSESFPLKRERTAAEISGLEKWASIYGRGKRKELKQFTPSQERLFKDLKMEAYDVVLDYLLSEGHADTVDEAHYVMMQLDSEYIQNVIQERAWWDPAGLFTKTQKEIQYSIPAPWYNPKKGTTRAQGKDYIIAPLTTGGNTRYVVQKPGDPKKDPSILASRGEINHADLGWSAAMSRLEKGSPEIVNQSAAARKEQQAIIASKAQLEKDKAEARKRAQDLGDENAARETQAPPPIVVKPKPKPTPVVAAKPAAPVAAKPAAPVAAKPAAPVSKPEPKLSKLQQDILDLRQMRADSLNRQGNIDAAQKLQTEVDTARADKKMPPKVK